MLTGRKAFEGRSQSSVIAAIMHVDPPGVSVVQPMTPPAMDRIVKVCLAKDPDERWQTAHDLALQFEWVAEGGSLAGVAAPAAARRRSRERLAWALLAVSILLIIALAVPAARYFEGPPAGELSRFLIETPAMPNPYLVSVSPDGRKVAFVATSEANITRLFVRPIDSVTAEALPGTEGALHPFWSPDSRYIAFGAGSTLKKVEATGGPPQVLCNLAIAGGTWNSDGVIVFSNGGRLHRVSAAGGVPAAITTPDQSLQESGHLWPYFLPDGKHYLYLAQNAPDKRAIYVGALDSDQRTRLITADSMPAFAPPGFLLFQRQGTLFAQEFDAKRLTIQGEPVRLAEGVPFNPGNGRAAFAVSSNGTLVYRSGAVDGALRQLAWLDREGKQLETVGQPGPFANFALSPDGKRIVIWRTEPGVPAVDLWTLEFSTGILSRLTFDPAGDVDPVWSPDGKMIVFSSNRQGRLVMLQKVVGAREETVLHESTDGMPWWADDWSPDGRFIIGNINGRKIFAMPMTGGDRKPAILFDSQYGLDEPHFSPDSNWIAYASGESGRSEIYVASFPEFKSIRQVSAGGGLQPRWRGDGKELFYLSVDRRLMSIDVKNSESSLDTSSPKPLFETRVPEPIADYYAPSADGRRFLVLNPRQEDRPTPITVVLNWTAALK